MEREHGRVEAAASIGGAAGLLWADPQGSRRGPKPKFTLEQIADAGIAIADAEGLEAVTMQRVAERVGATKMALYRYVPGRSELDAVMLDRAIGRPGEPRRTTGWKASLTAWALDLFERSTAHPWAVELVQSPHTPGPKEMLWFEAGLSILNALPLTASERLDVLAVLSGHVMSLVRQGIGGVAAERELSHALAPILAAMRQDYPLTAAAFARVSDEERDRGLRFGIDRVLDGVEVLVARRPAD